jgi:polysaccharide chain length determinant protein (PEP-CTERM system associated)
MEELLRQVLGYLRGMWRFRWWGLALTWIVGAVGCVVVYIIPDKYESSARVYVDTKSLLLSVMKETGTMPNIDQQIIILGRTLISRPNMGKLIDRADLDFTISSAAQREALITHLIDTIEIRSSGRDNLYTLSYTDSRPVRAQRVVYELTTLFVETGLGDKQIDMDQTKRFLDEQVRIYEQKLAEAEDRLKQYQLKHIDLIDDSDGGGLVTKIAAINNQLAEALLAQREAEQERDALYKQTKASQRSGGVWLPEFDDRIEAMKRSIDESKLRYTDEHPEVRNAQRMLADLEAQREARLKEVERDDSGSSRSDSNPAIIQLRTELGKADAKVAAARARAQVYQSRLTNAQESGRTRTEIEAQLAQLNRDYDINKKKYEELVRQRVDLNIGESGPTAIDFKVIDPANRPEKPSAPNRLLLMPLVALFALVAGAALMFLISQLKPSFIDARTLGEVLGLPVLGVVTMLATSERKRKRVRGVLAFGGGVAGFVMCMGAATFALVFLQR